MSHENVGMAGEAAKKRSQEGPVPCQASLGDTNAGNGPPRI
jgi:hypothetical protein